MGYVGKGEMQNYANGLLLHQFHHGSKYFLLITNTAHVN